jgi:hypothetical protein
MATPSVEEDVAYLKQLAEAGASGVPSGGKYFLVWAVAISFGLAMTYGSVTGLIPIDMPGLNFWWGGLLAIGWFVSFLLGRADAAKPEGLRFANRISTATWIATGAGLTAMWLGLAVSGAAHQAIMMPVAAAAIGVGTAVTATVFRLHWLYAVAAAWWFVAFVSFLMLQTAEFILFSAAAVLVLQGGTGVALMILERRQRA